MASLHGLLVLTALGGGPRAGESTAPERIALDLWQTVQACRLLKDDATLAPHHIGVRVRDRVAILWGPVVSAEIAIQAEDRLRTMVELIDVRNELFVMPEDGRIRPAKPPAPPPGKAPAPLRDPVRPFLRDLPGEMGPTRNVGSLDAG